MKYTELPCMNRLLSTTITLGRRNEMARQLAIACKKDNIEYKHALNRFGRRFYANCSKYDFDFSEVAKCFLWAYKRKYVFIHCPTITKAGSCNDKLKSQCELYDRKKTEGRTKKKKPTKLELRNILKNLVGYIKKIGIYEHFRMAVPNKEINKIAGEHQKTIWKILLDEVGCRTTFRGKPIEDTVVITKINLLKLKKNLHNYVRKHGIIPEVKKRGRPKAKINMKKVRKMGKKSYTLKQIAEKLNISYNTLNRKLKEHQIKLGRAGRPKTKINLNKLIQLDRKGLSTREIARVLRISHVTVYNKLKDLKEQY